MPSSSRNQTPAAPEPKRLTRGASALNIVKGKPGTGNEPPPAVTWTGNPGSSGATLEDFKKNTSGVGSPTQAVWYDENGMPHTDNWKPQGGGGGSGQGGGPASPFAAPAGAGYGSGSVFEGIGDYAGVFGGGGAPAAAPPPGGGQRSLTQMLDEVAAHPEARRGYGHFADVPPDVGQPEARSGYGHFANGPGSGVFSILGRDPMTQPSPPKRIMLGKGGGSPGGMP